MAHTCPDCGSYCCCNGDIDDCDWGESLDCVCCLGREEECDICGEYVCRCNPIDDEFDG